MEIPPQDEDLTPDKSDQVLEGPDQADAGNDINKGRDLFVGMQIFGMQGDKTWHRGQLVSIQGKGPAKQFLVKFDDKSKILLPSNHVAYVHHPPVEEMFVGSQVVANYKYRNHVWLYGGIVAETPSAKNKMRYLIFFIDGFASYVARTELHAVYTPSTILWEIIEDGPSREFIKQFIRTHPDLSMFEPEIGQNLTVEWRGTWWKCNVEEVDCSLMKILFMGNEHCEWIYRGSTRLLPLFEVQTAATSVHDKVPLQMMESNKEPEKPSTRDQIEDVAQRKHTVPSTLQTMPSPQPARNGYLTAAQLQRIALNERVPQETSYKVPTSKLAYVPHVCDCTCLAHIPVFSPLGKNPLLVPLLYDFRRMIAQRQDSQKMPAHVTYKTECGLSLRNMPELKRYLFETNCAVLSLDMFCFDPLVKVNRKFQPGKPYYYMPDITYGKEDVPVSCINEIDRTSPPHMVYLKERLSGKGVFINTDPDFLVGCDCTDGCRDRSKCACHQLTIQATACAPGGQMNPKAGYLHKRLVECQPTGVYECNKRCKCNVNMCTNRLVQHGLQVRLQLFKTQNKGWGIRCLDDIAKGTFICIYTGKILTSHFADMVGLKTGDEYFAKLDYLECAENIKKRYERHVEVSSESSGVDLEEESNEEEDDSDDSSDDDCVNDETIDDVYMWQSRSTRWKESALATVTGQGKTNDCKLPEEASENRCLSSNTASDLKGRPPLHTAEKPNPPGMDSNVKQKAEQAKETQNPYWFPWYVSCVCDEDVQYIPGHHSVHLQLSRSASVYRFGLKTKVYGYNPSPPKLEGVRRPITNTFLCQLRRRSAQTLSETEIRPSRSSEDTDTDSSEETAEQTTTCRVSHTIAASSCEEGDRQQSSPVIKPVKRQFAVKSTRGFTTKSASGITSSQEACAPAAEGGAEGGAGRRTTRQFYEGDESCYIIDAKLEGNLGRYLNHSCSPNLFVQNVFVDTHDLRFPWVAFFASKRIRAGAELTWNYNYEVGAVKGKTLLCRCGSVHCRGRLL